MFGGLEIPMLVALAAGCWAFYQYVWPMLKGTASKSAPAAVIQPIQRKTAAAASDDARPTMFAHVQAISDHLGLLGLSDADTRKLIDPLLPYLMQKPNPNAAKTVAPPASAPPPAPATK